uniref:Uncharacterized protein n=1 Tax=Stomoxys calcitrans TaxID=35570 RepID=A0A1I8Q472_STOCA
MSPKMMSNSCNGKKSAAKASSSSYPSSARYTSTKNKKGVVQPKALSPSTSPSSCSSASSLWGSLTALSSSASAASMLTCHAETSLEVAPLLVTPSTQKQSRRNKAAAANAITSKVANEIASLGSLKDNYNNNDNINDTNNNNNNNKVFSTRTMPSLKIMSYQHIFALLTVLLFGLASVNGLKCHMCGQYNEGVGSITPCLNYSDQYAHLYLKECSKKSEKYCVV